MSERFSIEVGRRRVANGGWEWFLVVGGEPVYSPAGVGIFTEPDVTAVEVLPRLLAKQSQPEAER